MRITKVITKTGDKGMTGLVGGERISKASRRVEAYGNIDELNSLVGFLRAFLRERYDGKEAQRIGDVLKVVQEHLFVVGSDLATPSGKEGLKVTDAMITYLEQQAEEFGGELGPLKEFVLPAGDVVTSLFHVARTITRRSERRVVKLQENEKMNGKIVKYLNRLSDFLFILGRFYAKMNNIQEDIIDFSDISNRFKD